MARMYECGLIIGRFHTFTIGHEHLINTALLACDRVLIFIGSAQLQGSERNPFNIATRLKMLNEIYGDNERVMIYALPDLTDEKDDKNTAWGEYLLSNADTYLFKEPDCMIYGLSKEEGGRATDWFDVDRLEKMNFILVPRGTVPISATEVRNFMVINNRREWQKWVNPRLHKLYEELRSELMTIPYYKELEKTLLTESIETK